MEQELDETEQPMALLARLTPLNWLSDRRQPQMHSLVPALMAAHQHLASPPADTTTFVPSPHCWIFAPTHRKQKEDDANVEAQAPLYPQQMTLDTVRAPNVECSSANARKLPGKNLATQLFHLFSLQTNYRDLQMILLLSSPHLP